MRQILSLFGSWVFFFSQGVYADQLDADLSLGYEKITSPIVRIEPDSASILVEGRTKLSGKYLQLGLNGLKDWDLGNQYTFNLSSNLIIKDAFEAEDLNYGVASLDAIFRKTIGKWSIGIGPAIQRNWLVNSRFRDTTSLQVDLTYLKPDYGFTNFYVGLSRNKYVSEFNFLDSKLASASITHHIENLSWGFSALDIQFSATREKNLRDFEDLSNHSYFARTSIDRQMLGLTWSAGVSVTKSHFDAPFLDGFAKRNDNYVSFEFSVEKEISDKLNMSIDLIQATNFSNVILYESDYELISLGLRYTH